VPTPDGLFIDPAHAHAFLWAFVIGYCVPILLISLPGITIHGVNTKHTLAGWYQQWNLYISSCHHVYAVCWRASNPQPIQPSVEETLKSLERIYGFVFAMAAVTHWAPILVSLAEMLRSAMAGKTASRFLQPRDVLLPASPFSDRKAESASEGGRWLIQWDVVTGTTATILWAAGLYFDACRALSLPAPYGKMAYRTMWWGALGGPMGVPVAYLWSRDELVYTYAHPIHK